MTPQAVSMLAVLGITADGAWTAFLVLVRVGAAIALMPAFGEMTVPVRVRLAVALAFTAVVAPAVSGLPMPPAGFAAILAEVAAGLLLGLGLRLMIHALQIAGTIAAQSIALTQLFGGTAGEPQPAVANVLIVTGLSLAVAGGMHVEAARLVIASYGIVPPGAVAAPGAMASLSIAQVSRAFGLAFSLAAPFVAAALLYNVALGLINRAMPALMVTFVGAPALTLGALALLALATPVLLMVWIDAFRAQLSVPFAAP